MNFTQPSTSGYGNTGAARWRQQQTGTQIASEGGSMQPAGRQAGRQAAVAL